MRAKEGQVIVLRAFHNGVEQLPQETGIACADFDTETQGTVHVTVLERFRTCGGDDGLREVPSDQVLMVLPAPGIYLFQQPDNMYYADHEVREDGWHRVFSSDLPGERFVGPWTPPVERAYLASSDGKRLPMFGEVHPIHRMAEDLKDGVREMEPHGLASDCCSMDQSPAHWAGPPAFRP